MGDMNIARAILAADEKERDRYLYREVIQQAVMYRIFCECGQVLDMRSAVLFEGHGRSAVTCPGCAERVIGRLPEGHGVKITKGRELYSARKGKGEVSHAS